jgi:histidine ammonia-lyase
VERCSPRTQEAFRLVREHVPFLDGDRAMDVDIATTVELIQSGAVAALVG